MKKITLLFTFLLLALFSNAQKKMAIYGEILGNGLLVASINFEYNFNNTGQGFGLKAGLSVLDVPYGQFTIPVLGHYLIGKKEA